MFFHLPPVLPVATLTGTVAITKTSQPTCERGSRDCFPKDLVGAGLGGVDLGGAVSEPHPALTADLRQLVLSDLFSVTV